MPSREQFRSTFLAVAIALRVFVAFLAVRIVISIVARDTFLGSTIEATIWIVLGGQLMFQTARVMAGEGFKWRNLLFLR